MAKLSLWSLLGAGIILLILGVILTHGALVFAGLEIVSVSGLLIALVWLAQEYEKSRRSR